MNEFSRQEIYNSYVFLKNALGIRNKPGDHKLLIGIRYTGDQILAINENGLRAILLLKQGLNERWYFLSPYPELEPLATYIQKAVQNSKNYFLSEPAFDALKEVCCFDTYSS